MYKYQEKVIDGIDDAVYKIEQITEEHFRLHMGWRHTNEFENANIPIFVEVNGNFRFTQQTAMDEVHDCYSKCELYNYNRIEINEDIFLDINKLIDKVLKENAEREEFYNSLNEKLNRLNESSNYVHDEEEVIKIIKSICHDKTLSNKEKCMKLYDLGNIFNQSAQDIDFGGNGIMEGW